MKVFISLQFNLAIWNIYCMSSLAVPLATLNHIIPFVNINASQSIKYLKNIRVFGVQKKPFVYRKDNDQSIKGIEYELMKVIETQTRSHFSYNILKSSMEITGQNFNDADLMIGGIYPNLSNYELSSISRAYEQDDFTWCIQKAKNFPFILSVAFIAKPECWFLYVFGVGYGIGFVLYVIIQLDTDYKHRNQRDWHYTTWLISLPVVIGVNQRYQPKHQIIRVFYFCCAFNMMLAWNQIFFCGIRFVKVPVQMWQISTISELVENDFRLAGPAEVLSLISHDERYKHSQIRSFFTCKTIDSCLEHLQHDDNYDLAIGGSRKEMLNSKFNSKKKIFCFDRRENIAFYHPSVIMKTDMELNSRINQLISNAFESGLFLKWDRDNQKKKERLIPFEPPLEYKLEHMGLPFCFMWFPGLFMATSAILVEHLIFRKMNQPSRSWYWKYLEQFFDGERHYWKNLVKEKKDIIETDAS